MRSNTDETIQPLKENVENLSRSAVVFSNLHQLLFELLDF